MKNFLIIILLISIIAVIAYEKIHSADQSLQEQKIALEACKLDARSTVLGKFKICSFQDKSGGVGSANIFDYVIYDTSGLLVTKDCIDKASWNVLVAILPIIEQMNYSAKVLGDDFYLLSFNEAGTFSSQVCGEKSDRFLR